MDRIWHFTVYGNLIIKEYIMFGKIIGTGAYAPKKILKNDDLAQFVDTNDEWIKERTGVEKRHVMEDETTADMAVKAAMRAVKAAGIHPEEIDMIIVSTVSSNLILPNTACFVQEQIGAVNAICFDINTACTGFIMAYNTVQSYMNMGLVNTALIIGAEGLSRIVDWSDRTTCILFGDGAGAAVLRKDESAVFDTVMHADGTKGKALTCENGYANRNRLFDKTEVDQSQDNTYVSMDGQEVFRFAVKQIPICIQELLDKMNKTEADIDLFVLHQANKRIVQGIAKRIGTVEEKVPMNLMNYGNTSSACIPILLDELVKTDRIKKGDRVIMSGFGAGLTWAATYMEF